MFIFEITYQKSKCYVPIIAEVDESAGVFRTLLSIPPRDKLHVFSTVEAAQKTTGFSGYDTEIKSIVSIDLDNILFWANSTKYIPVNLYELEIFDGLIDSIFIEIDHQIPSELDLPDVCDLTTEIFFEPKLAKFKNPSITNVSQDALQRKANNPMLKKYFQKRVGHFNQVILAHENI